MTLHVAVDFGTSSTCVTVSVDGREPQVVVVDGQPLLSSAVFAAVDGTLFVGQEAERQASAARDTAALGTIRLILAKLKDVDIAARTETSREGVADNRILSMLQGMIKQRNESIVLYEKGNRTDLADKEKAEIAVIERFLPKQMDEAAVEAVVAEAVAAAGAKTVKDMGGVMAALKAKYAGQMDFAKASAAVKKALAG